MVMTKAERDRMAELELVSALRWTQGSIPDLSAPVHGEFSISGWRVFGAICVERAWSNFNRHGQGSAPELGRTASRGGISLHSTEEAALLELRHRIEREAALRLMLVDQQLEEIEANRIVRGLHRTAVRMSRPKAAG